ncbi:phospholipase A2 inhibitor and Ly6/PLAUR domain-containing protein-like [Hyla sarda]|uniref:phospholipase A2 inhibitor and Ly6/PLAUR domain-containing protein-like n=1 Tax=Hyla sarda TaxID=327740 RepID=UPI0024C24A12|nr:phospholipase A2 inhibitor and Ly6/PLAUR domain-containing protein-like [Hyla sarda]
MFSLAGILSLLSALAATSYALSCTVCTSTTTTTCAGSSVTCPVGYQCGSSYTETTAGGSKVAVLVRSCLPSSQCNVEGSMSVQLQKIRMVTSCCETDACIPAISDFPTQSSKPNGVTCPSCVSVGSASCSTSDTIQCTEDEKMCLLQTTEVMSRCRLAGSTSLSTALRGCATKSICDLGSQSQSVGGVTTEVKFICTSGGISVRTVVLTPAIVCLLLLKWFF